MKDVSSTSIRYLRMYRGVGRVNGKIAYRIQIAAETQGEALLTAETWNPDAEWRIHRTKSTGQPLLGWCNHG